MVSSFSCWTGRSAKTSAAYLAKKDDDLRLPQHNVDGRRRVHPSKKALLRCASYALVSLFIVFLVRRITYVQEQDIVRPYSPHRDGDVASKIISAQQLLTASPRPTKPKAASSSFKSNPGEPDEADRAVGENRDNAQTAASLEYKGVIEFKALYASLRQLARLSAGTRSNNVLFAAANLQSAAVLLPMACQRFSSQKDGVFFALFGESNIDLKELLEVNSIDDSCKLLTIDARADQRRRLNTRLVSAAARAIYLIISRIEPLAVIVDGSSGEDRRFLKGINKQLRGIETTSLIELPENAQSKLSWISRLDATALAEWNNVHFDILIHAPPTGTGNIKRLLRSLAMADLSGHTTPQITVELPTTIEAPLEQFLRGFRWPNSNGAGARPNMLMLRHRVQHGKTSESAVRLLESFWPKDAKKNHALILSSHAEVSPQFFHYVKYALLHRLYSKTARIDDPKRLMFGLSFNIPETNIHDAKPFTAPYLPTTGEEIMSSKKSTPFVWEAPSSDAMLVFGDKWIELHGFVSQALELKKTGTAIPSLLQSRDVPENRPVWVEFMMQLFRLRGYFTMYPSKETADAIIGVYNDLPYAQDGREEGKKNVRPGMQASSSFDAGSQVGMLQTLPDNGVMPSPHDVPVLSWDGQSSTVEEMTQEAHTQAVQFRRETGKCQNADDDFQRDRFARDLFCALENRQDETVG